MTTKHADQPQLCDECLKLIRGRAEQPGYIGLNIQPCVHNGVVGIASQVNGAIVAYEIWGPMTLEQMSASAKKIGENVRAYLDGLPKMTRQ